MQITPVNEQVLLQAAEAIVGPQATAAIVKLYQMLDKAVFDGYQLGVSDAQQGVEAALDNAFDNGWKYGEAEGKAVAEFDIDNAKEEGWDDGYLMGVQHARANPALADDIVIDILTDAAAYALNGELEADDVDFFDAVTSGEAKVNAWPEGADWSALGNVQPTPLLTYDTTKLLAYDPSNVSDSGDTQP